MTETPTNRAAYRQRQAAMRALLAAPTVLREKAPPAGGPGTELKKLFRSIGIQPRRNCECNRRAAEMDREGAEWCRQNLETIVDWLEEEAGRRPWTKVIFTRLAARVAVQTAIRRAEGKRMTLEEIAAKKGD